MKRHLSLLGRFTSIGAALATMFAMHPSAIAANLTWDGGKGTGQDVWDLSHANWLNGTSSQVFSNNGDNVLFPSVGSNNSTAIKISGTLTPGTITIQGSSFSFTPVSSTDSILAAGAISISSSLTLNASSTTALLGSSSGITVNSGGSLILAGSGNDIADNTSITLAGGSIGITSGGSEKLGALTLTSSPSTLDFSTTSGGASLVFDSISGSGQTLNVFNFTLGSDHLYLNAPSNATINFYSGTTTTSGSVSYSAEVVPEPSTILAGLGLVGFLGWRERRRISSLFKRAEGEEALATA